MKIIIELIILVFLIMLSGFFSGSETAFMSLGKLRYKEYIKKKKKDYEIVEKLKSDPHTLLSTILIGNNIVNIAAASLATLTGTEIFLEFGLDLPDSVIAGIITGLLTIIVLIFGEVIPKTHSAKNFEKVIGKGAKIIYYLSIIFYPLIKLLDLINRIVTKKEYDASSEEKVTEDEIKTIVNVGSEEGGIDRYEGHLIHKIFQFDDKVVKEIMSPRTKVEVMDANIKIKETLPTLVKQGYSRLPIYKDKPDNIVGIFHIRDVLGAIEKKKLNKTIDKISSKPFFVPETKPIDELFKEMQRKKIQLAIVVDEFGGFSGVVTVEDLIEEIVGEIYDEDEAKNLLIKKLKKNEFIVSGECTLRELKEKTGFSLDGFEADTLSGYIQEKLGKIPIKGEEIKIGNIKIIAENVTEKTVKKAKIKK